MNGRDAEAARAALAYIIARDPDIVADAFRSLPPGLARPGMSFLALLVAERARVLRDLAVTP